MPKRTIITTPDEAAMQKKQKRVDKTMKQKILRHKKNQNQIKNRLIQSYSTDQVLHMTSNIPSSSTSVINTCNTISNRVNNQNYNVDMQAINVEEHYIGTMHILCKYCNAKYFSAEMVANKKNSFNDCCSHGEVSLDPLPTFPQQLKKLFDGTHSESSNFYNRIRYYNSIFSFASFNANLVHQHNQRSGPYCFKIQGQIYYQINTSLYPPSGDYPSYGQLFFIDAEEAINIRAEHNTQLNENILITIENVLRECNIFVHSYQMMKDELKLMSLSNNGQEPEMQLLFTLKPGMDRNRYNFQRINEVAAIFSTTADGDIPESYVTIRNTKSKSLQYVSTMDPNVEPWIYPLFYPYGSQGWNQNLFCVNNKNRRVTRNAYIKYRMAIRSDFNVLLMGRRLFQQWVVDNYVKIEKDRIDYCRRNQIKLRAESYQGLIDHLNNKAADKNNSNIGKIVILPSSFIGSPRNMLQLYQDSMAIVRKFGKPDLFITMTCNPRWREIEENLFEGQTASDRPDIVARVFEIKKDHLINIICKQKLFGEVLAYVYVIEYQKRGLPHVHLLITLKENFKITTPDIVDKFINAEIPCPNNNIKLHNIVMKNMIHGPCGNWCLENGKCTKNYPKSFREMTTMDENGYPYYRRRNTNTVYDKNHRSINNQFVVPYNPHLLMVLNCHVNVEIVASIKSVKYLYKYIYKGHDSAAINILEPDSDSNILNHDEINNHIETRYVGPVEACWRILNKRLQDKSHSIVRLPVHLPNQHNVILQNDDDSNMLRALEKQTMLVEFFELNKRDVDARYLSYIDIPTYYVFKKQTHSNRFTWEKRLKHFNVIGRMYSISPTQIELFHLRLLLIAKKNIQSFEDIRTVNGTKYDTHVAACLAMGLIEDDDEWRRVLHEAEIWMMPYQLRRLFVRILIFCQPLNPQKLWDEFKDAMSQDFSRTLTIEQSYKTAYVRINAMLILEGTSLESFPTMEQITEIENIDDHNDDVIHEHKILGEKQYKMLNKKQKTIIDAILNTVMNPQTSKSQSKYFYIDGPGGSGKTFIYTTLFHLLRNYNKNVCNMAYTGIAATLLPTGKTVHKTFNMPVPLFSDSTSNVKCNSKNGEYLINVDVFIWDEAPMAPRYALELVDRTLRDLMNTDLLFGGKIMVLGGDFRQLLPVMMHATRNEMINLSIKCSNLWKNFSKFTLIQNMRALPGETEFSEFLLQIGDGLLNDHDDNINLLDKCVASINDDIVYDIYGKIIKEKRYDELSKSAILSARNVDVENINEKVVQLLDKSSERIYTSIDSVENCDNGDINDSILPEYLNSLNPPNFPPHELRLRLYSVIMLIRNLSVNEGLCNGTRLLIIDLANNLLKCKILSGDKIGDIVFLNRITLYCENVYPFTFKRRQFPIKLAFAMTINKSQGQTFHNIGIDLRKDVFNHGQLYVACSRVRSWESLKIYLGNQRQNNIVKNYVYRELYSL